MQLEFVMQRCETGPTVCSSISEKTRKSNHLHMSKTARSPQSALHFFTLWDLGIHFLRIS